MASVFTQFCGINYAKIKLKGGIMAYLTCLEEKELDCFQAFCRASRKSSPTSQGGKKPGAGPFLPAFPRTF